MKHFSVTLLAVVMALTAMSQTKIPKNANRFVYQQVEYGETIDTSFITVTLNGSTIEIQSAKPEGTLISGYATEVTYVDYDADSITVIASFEDGASYFYRRALSRDDIEWTLNGSLHSCSINSNSLVFDMDESTDINVNPLPYYGIRRGILRSFKRNGQTLLRLVKADYNKKLKPFDSKFKIQNSNMTRVSPRELDRIKKERLVVTTRIFDHEQISWGKENAHIDGYSSDIPYDTILHYAGGTLILKRVMLPILPSHYQHFIELHQQSNGDAYDRTGSIFAILPQQEKDFFYGINNHPDSLPTIIGRDGQHYQGVLRTKEYVPPLELVRFFTPFGIGKFNERMKDFGIDWRDETFYRQEITDAYPMLKGSVIFGAWIGNYDNGGHLLTMDIKSYPNDLTTPDDATWKPNIIYPLFNTCNVLEMAGQNYGKIFATDSLTVSFSIPDAASSARLRYISTGHGGWDGGDEFVPKTNTILIDGKPAFAYTPWRQDCGCYRDLNPVSGNFWNGLSSSDYSRSGWCPGTATQPVYFDLSPWIDGKTHTLTVAIPQGKPVEGMFSHWAVSGSIVIEY
ncbi:MAG: hypothetical protein J5526_03550 [Bacteroidales bacterium]|nr:hypothetical protein [Bacteroidales bacterium]